MKPEFSEFSYGFALTYEIMNALQPETIGAPLFPYPIAEGGTGFDTDFVPEGIPLFLQFRLADCLKTSRASQWLTYNAPFFRILIQKRTQSNQYSLLRTLSATEPDVYFAAPAFYRQIEFNQAFVSAQILGESRFIPLKNLPDLDDDAEHYVTYGRNVSDFHWHSAQAQVPNTAISGSAWLEQVKRQSMEPRSLGAEYFVELRRRLVTYLREYTLQPDLFLDELPFDWENTQPLVVFRDLRYLLVTYFGLETIILRPTGRAS